MMEMLRCLVPLLAVAAQWFLSFLVAKSKREAPFAMQFFHQDKAVSGAAAWPWPSGSEGGIPGVSSSGCQDGSLTIMGGMVTHVLCEVRGSSQRWPQGREPFLELALSTKGSFSKAYWVSGELKSRCSLVSGTLGPGWVCCGRSVKLLPCHVSTPM